MTCQGSFHVTSTKQVKVEMMHTQNYFPYGNLPKLNAKAVVLPYRGGRLSMVIILPNDVNGLAGIQRNIGDVLQGGKNSQVWESLTTDDQVELSLPKFKVETTIENLNEVLENVRNIKINYALKLLLIELIN